MKYFCDKCESYTERDDHKCCRKCGADLRDASLAPSSSLAGFVINKEIGRGANGVVYLAEQRSLDRKVALKVLPDAKAEDPEFVKAFLKEARVAARLNHPGIIQIYDAGVTDEGIYFLAMELIDGKSLERILQSKGALKVDKAVNIALGLARALEYSWNKEHMFHGDIKPDNIMINKEGQTKLADFGLAKTIFDEKSDDIMATPMYAPPEVIRAEHEKIGFKSDMYSLGVMLYEILCGTAPFTDDDYQKVLDRHLTEKHVALSEKLPGIDKSLSALIDRLLQKDPAKRPASWSRVIENLEIVRVKSEKAKWQFNLGTFIAVLLVLGALGGAVFMFYYEWNLRADNLHKSTPDAKVPRRSTVPAKPALTPKPPQSQPVPPARKLSPEKKKEMTSGTVLQKIDKKGSKVEEFLEEAVKLEGKTIRDISRLRFQTRKMLQNESLSATEKVELQLCLEELNKVIARKQQAAADSEAALFREKLAKESLKWEKRKSRDLDINIRLAGRNNIFKALGTFFAYPEKAQTKQAIQVLLKNTQGLDRNLPEYGTFVFLAKNLPRNYDREGIIFNNLDQLTGKELPWKIRDMEYVITGGSREGINLRTSFSKDVYSRRKISPDKLDNYYWSQLLDEFLIKDDMNVTASEIKNTACWLLLNAGNELFREFVCKYSPENSASWLNCRKVVDAVSNETAAFASWQELSKQLSGLDPKAYGSLNSFVKKYSDTGVYQLVKDILSEYHDLITAFYPEAVIERLEVGNLSENSPEGKIFSAFNRYACVKALPLKLRKTLRNLFWRKLKGFSPSQDAVGNFGIFTDAPCGSVYAWSAARLAKKEFLSLNALPGWLDTDNWSFIRRIFKETVPENYQTSEFPGGSRYYPYYLYNIGLAASQYCRWKVVDKVFSDFKLGASVEQEADSCINDALLAELALRTDRRGEAEKVFSKYKSMETGKIDNNEMLIALLKFQMLLVCPVVDESAISQEAATLKSRFAQVEELKPDVELLEKLRQFVCADFKTSFVEVKADFFAGTVCPWLHARLWLEAAARDRLLYRNSMKIPDLIKAARAVLTPSAFRSELFGSIYRLELAQDLFTPEELRSNLNRISAELQPCATRSYPALLTLLFASGVLDYRKLPLLNLAWFAREFSAKCPVFSHVDKSIHVLLTESEPLKTMAGNERFKPLASQKMYLWILAAAKEKRSGSFAACLVKLEAMMKELSWSERLLLQRIIELLKNIR